MSARCNTPRKRRYRTEEVARDAVAAINERYGLTGTDREQELYLCCGHFHARTIAKHWRMVQLPVIYDGHAAGWTVAS